MDVPGTICCEHSQALGNLLQNLQESVALTTLKRKWKGIGGGRDQSKGRLLRNLVDHGWADLPGMAHS